MGIFHHHHHLRRRLGFVRRRSQLKALRRIALRKSSSEVQRCASSAPIKETATCGKPAGCRWTSRIWLHHPTSTRHHPSAALVSPHRWLAWSSLSTWHYEATRDDHYQRQQAKDDVLSTIPCKISEQTIMVLWLHLHTASSMHARNKFPCYRSTLTKRDSNVINPNELVMVFFHWIF